MHVTPKALNKLAEGYVEDSSKLMDSPNLMGAAARVVDKILDIPSRFTLNEIENKGPYSGADQWTSHALFTSPSPGVQLTEQVLVPLQERFAKAEPPLFLRQDPKGNLEITGSFNRTSTGYNFVNDMGRMVQTLDNHEPEISEAILASKLDVLQKNPNQEVKASFVNGLEALKARGAKLPVVETPNSSSIALIG
jgi:hypothetical protein